MSGRRAWRWLAPALLGLSSAACAPEEVSVFPRPDVILVVIDTWRWDDLAANGSPREGITPSLDRLAASGVRFSRAFTSSPWTAASVGTMMTGQYPTVHGAYGRFRDVGSLRAGVPTLAERLGRAGYRTLAVVNGFFLAPTFGFDRGFETYDYVASTNREIRRAGQAVDDALEHLRQERNRGPLFLFLHLFDPHLAYDPPEGWRERYVPEFHGMFEDLGSMRGGGFDPAPEELAYIRGLYDAEVSYVDHELGRFFDSLDEVLPGRERMILVTADHGEEFGDHGGWEHGQSMYRELVQVPLVIVPPASRPAARSVVEAQVRTLDVAPTLLEVSQAGPRDTLPGSSLFPWFEGQAAGHDLVAYSEREHLGSPSAALRDGDHALVLWLEDGRMELYDQRSDPLERTDLAAAQPQRVAELRKALDEHATLLERVAEGLADHEGVELTAEEYEQMRSLGYTKD